MSKLMTKMKVISSEISEETHPARGLDPEAVRRLLDVRRTLLHAVLLHTHSFSVCHNHRSEWVKSTFK